ncbi:hypothetical protein [Salinivibrio costicola]|uniref:hypothetical protein n=1 Tax=Salinivibrio costicola TaxID=51367 RepID=UPI0004702F0B|nr:hypothetical protein [Salinivibrio costicola]
MARQRRELKRGTRYGRLIVIYTCEFEKGVPTRSGLFCECDNVIERSNHDILQGKIRSCGCLAKELLVANTKSRTKYLKRGEQFGALTVLGLAERTEAGHQRYHVCCACGTIKKVFGHNLKRGNVKSCGKCEHHPYARPNKELLGTQK